MHAKTALESKPKQNRFEKTPTGVVRIDLDDYSYASFAPGKAAQRILAEALARDLGPRGIHVAYIVIDAFIDMPAIRQRVHTDKRDEFFAKPTAIAEEFFQIAHQDRSAWSFNVELRPFGEKW